MQITDLTPVQPVRDHEAAVTWYSRLFGREPDRRPMEATAEWDLGAGRSVQVFADAESAGGCTIILGVEDVEATLVELADRGLDGEATTVPSGQFRLAPLEDPSGNTVVVAQTLHD